MSSLALLSIVRDYLTYRWSLELWFGWTPYLGILAIVLTVNFQSFYLGSMSYQYRYHDTAFQIAYKFADFEYLPLIKGVEGKLHHKKTICQKYYLWLTLCLSFIAVCCFTQTIILQLISVKAGLYFAFMLYILSIVCSILAIAIVSLAILAAKRQMELIELCLFWLRSASTLKYIEIASE